MRAPPPKKRKITYQLLCGRLVTNKVGPRELKEGMNIFKLINAQI